MPDCEAWEQLAPGEAMLVDWPTDRYHADRTCVSNSWLGDLIESPALYRAKRDGLIVDEPGPALIFGTHLHLAVLEPSEWRRRLFDAEPTKPKGARGNAKKKDPTGYALYETWKSDVETWKLGVLGMPDALVISESARARVESCAEAVRAHEVDVDRPGASDLLEHATAFEQTIVRRDEETGILLRHRYDMLSDLAGQIVIGDLKSSADPSPDAFARSAHRYGYHRQAAIYADGLAALHPDAKIHFVIIAVRSKPPFEVFCHQIEGEELELGRREYRAALEDLARRREDNDWLAPGQRGINRLHYPAYALKENNR